MVRAWGYGPGARRGERGSFFAGTKRTVAFTVVFAGVLVVCFLALPRLMPRLLGGDAKRPGDELSWDGIDARTDQAVRRLDRARDENAAVQWTHAPVVKERAATHAYVRKRVTYLRSEITRLDALEQPSDFDRARRSVCADELDDLVR